MEPNISIDRFFGDLDDEKDHELIKSILMNNTNNPNIKKPQPKRLFLYKKVNKHALSQIKDSYIHFSTPDKFNDPFDSVFAKNMLYASVERVFSKVGRKVNQEYFNYIYNKIEKIKKELKISCLTESNKDIKMWAYYAAGHSGICLEYDYEKYFFDASNPNIKLWPVFYTNQLQKLLEYSKTIDDDKIRFEFTPNILHLMSLCKLKIWKDEKEWRVVERSENFKTDKLSLPISSIYLGLKISNDDKNNVLNIAKKQNIPCYQMEVDYKKLGIIPRRI